MVDATCKLYLAVMLVAVWVVAALMFSLHVFEKA